MTVADGFVPTPPAVADWMAMSLFTEPPSADDRILFPGAGTGCLAAAVKRFCSVRDYPVPEAVAVDTSRERLATFEQDVASESPEVPPLSTRSVNRLRATYPTVQQSAERPVAMDADLQVADFLLEPPAGEFDYILANPPYTRYEALDADKRRRYRENFEAAEGQFGLFMPFIEQMQNLLAADGTLTFLAPVNYLVAPFAAPLREEIRRDRTEQFMLFPEDVFRNAKVQTVATTLSANPSLGKDGSFWLETFTYTSRVDDLLRDVGVLDEDQREESVEDYYLVADFNRRLLDNRRMRDGADGGYNMERIPGESHQSDLGNWA
jgi:hypothetical protein